MASEESPGRPGRRFVWEDGATAAIAAVALVFCARGRANCVPCAFLPLALPAFLLAVSGAYRRRFLGAARALWESLDGYPAGGPTPILAALAFVVLPSALVFLSNDHVDLICDTIPVIPTAISLINEGNTDLDEFYRDVPWWRRTATGPGGLPYFLQRSGAHLYSSYPAGMVPFAIPVVGLSRLAGGKLYDTAVLNRLEKLTASIVAASALGVFFLLALHLVGPAAAMVTTAILAVSSGMFTTVGQNLWQHDGVVLGSLTALLIEFRRPGRIGNLTQGVVCGSLPACRVTAVAFLVPFGVWVVLRSPRRAALIVVAATIAALPWVAYYLTVYGSPFGPSSSQMQGSLWSADVAGPLAGVLFSPGRGLLTYQPWVLLAFLAFLPAFRYAPSVRAGDHPPEGWECVCVAAVVLLIGVVSAWNCWWGGYCWGSRLVVEVVPLCALLCARPVATLLSTAGGRGVVLSLAILGALVHVPGIYLGASRWNDVYGATHAEAVWSWSRAPFLAPFNLPPR